MTNNQHEFIFRVLVNHKVHGYPNKVAPNYIEGDKRKQGKALRELVEAGYLTQTGKEFTATNKLWDELPTEGFDLIAQWEKDRKDGWNKRKQLDFVRFQALTDGQKKLVVECAGHYDWYICHTVPIQYDHKMEEGDLQCRVRSSTRIPSWARRLRFSGLRRRMCLRLKSVAGGTRISRLC